MVLEKFGEYCIRTVDSSDVEKVYEMRKRVCTESDTVLSSPEEITFDKMKSWIENWKDNPTKLFAVVEYEGEIVGQLWCWFIDNKIKLSHIVEFGLEIVSEHQNKGLGTKLCEIAVKWAKSKGAKRLQAETLEKNIPMRKILENFEFELEGKMVAYLKNGDKFEDVVIYGKIF
ncbi:MULTISPECIES: GNAT family N-acetyltransferase [Fervidobacterium]|uniref:GCN5-related N-acetyltransferase n=1 Tax=Fervidobacterium nodosum (strain ATCC 35602 / DSM 5306 / Rt17-B1) TaxID=381764 RepID=A7HJB5_FERNB|nr:MULTISPECIES: GNAT family N-acetyltransferase [Fervidobacterium]ABS59998.1 GCN5-related N-acetyltransferase [Fervidobacterium nodosum Rt17-B1]KAF2961280.1 GCN5 family acetyltransferase [Fervidobacterium sp. 2310opik-2]PHJ14273.1 GCN5 family acetyltransferase [Fervidobacterium sp. SC_NGM5_G05]HOJ94317.1 GNAT family N-acetyltransferase [Fervidobacterium nodosum]